MRNAGRIPVAAVLGALVACASQVTTQAPESAAPRAAATAAAAKDAPVRRDGYRRVTKDGIEYFCRAPVVTGSRMQRAETCLTKEQLDEMAADSEEFLRWLQGPVFSDGPASSTPAGGTF